MPDTWTCGIQHTPWLSVVVLLDNISSLDAWHLQSQILMQIHGPSISLIGFKIKQVDDDLSMTQASFFIFVTPKWRQYK